MISDKHRSAVLLPHTHTPPALARSHTFCSQSISMNLCRFERLENVHTCACCSCVCVYWHRQKYVLRNERKNHRQQQPQIVRFDFDFFGTSLRATTLAVHVLSWLKSDLWCKPWAWKTMCVVVFVVVDTTIAMIACVRLATFGQQQQRPITCWPDGGGYNISGDTDRIDRPNTKIHLPTMTMCENTSFFQTCVQFHRWPAIR